MFVTMDFTGKYLFFIKIVLTSILFMQLLLPIQVCLMEQLILIMVFLKVKPQ